MNINGYRKRKCHQLLEVAISSPSVSLCVCVCVSVWVCYWLPCWSRAQCIRPPPPPLSLPPSLPSHQQLVSLELNNRIDIVRTIAAAVSRLIIGESIKNLAGGMSGHEPNIDWLPWRWPVSATAVVDDGLMEAGKG